jgi:hypothetical protein
MIMIDRQLQMQNACFHHVKMIVLIKKNAIIINVIVDLKNIFLHLNSLRYSNRFFNHVTFSFESKL